MITMRNFTQRFIATMVSMTWHAMRVTGNGYRRHSLRNTGKPGDRRIDKEDCETKLQRKARLGQLTVR